MAKSRNEPAGPKVLFRYGDSIKGEKIHVEARKIKVHPRPKARSGKDQIQSAECSKTAQAWITREMRYVRDQN